MRWRRIAFWVTFSTLALIVLALSWLWTADLGVFKPQVERIVTEELGREFAIDGEFHVDLAGQTTLIAEELRYANPAWAEVDDMVTVRRAEVRIDLWSLFRGVLIIELLDIDDASILLLNPGDTAPNWERLAEWFAEPSSVEVMLGAVDIDRLRLRLDSAERERPLNLEVAYLDQSYRDDGFLDLRMDATLDGKVVRIDGELGTWDALLAGKDVHFDIGTVLDTFKLSARGRIDDVANPVRPEFQFSASSPDIDDLTKMLGLGDEGEGDINLSGEMRPLGSGRLSLSIEGNLGLTTIDTVGEVSDLQDFSHIQLKAMASGPDLGRVLRLAGIHEVREAPFMVKIDAETKNGIVSINEANMVYADARFDGSAHFPNFPSIDDAEISLHIEGPDLERFRYITGVPGAATGPFSITGTLGVRDDGIEILAAEVKSEVGKLVANGDIGDPHTFYGSHLRFRLTTDNLQRSANTYGIADLPALPATIRGSAEYAQDGVRSLEPIIATINDHSASVAGFVPLIGGAVGADLEIGVKGADLASLIGMFTAAERIPALAYDVTGRLRIEKQGYRLDGVTGTLGSSTFSTRGLLVPEENLAGSSFEIQARGPALEELVTSLSEGGVQDGPFELAAGLLFKGDRLEVRQASFERQNARLDLDVGLGLPVSRRWIDFDLRGRGNDVRDVLRQVQGLEAYEQPFSLDAKGSVRGDHWDFDRVVGAVGEAAFEARGDLALDDSAARTEFTLNLSIPNLADIGTVSGRRFNPQAFSLNAHAVGTAGVLTVDGMKVSIGDSDINGSFDWRNGDVPEVTVDVNSQRLVYVPILEPVEEYIAEPEFEDGRLIPEITIPFEAMQKMNASVSVDIGVLQRRNLRLSNILVDAFLQDGGLELRTLRFDGLTGTLLAKASLEPDGGAGTATLQVVARDMALGLRAANQDLAMRSDLEVNLRSTGTDTRMLAGNASGIIYADTRGGRIKNNELVTALYGDVLEETLNAINPFRKTDPYTEFECLIVPLSITDGQVMGAPNVFISTSKLRMVTQVSVNLKTEEIEIGIRNTPRRILSISAAELVNPYLQVVGTLASPRLAVDEAGVLITGGAAVATGGLSLLARGLWNRLLTAGDACKQMSKRAMEQLEGRLPDVSLEESRSPE
jgi:hypothetical protein